MSLCVELRKGQEFVDKWMSDHCFFMTLENEGTCSKVGVLPLKLKYMEQSMSSFSE